MKHFNKHVQCLRCLNPQIGKRTKHSKIFTVPSRPKKKGTISWTKRRKQNETNRGKEGLVWPLKHQYLETGERLNKIKKKKKKKNLVPKVPSNGGRDEEGTWEVAVVGREG